MWIDRSLGPELRRLSRAFPIVVLTGPRQVGKTSLLEETFPDLPYVTLDAGAAADEASSNPASFLDRLGTPAIIDEIQYAPSLLREIKVRADGRRGESGLWFLTGSQSFSLMAAVAESLAGRAAVLSLLGLSAEEWRAAYPDPPWEDFLLRGSWPALWKEGAEEPPRERWYQAFLATYLERDVRNVLRVSSLRDFERFLRAAGARTSQLLNLSDLARDVGIAPSTAREWMGVLVASNVVRLLEPYHRSLGKRIAKSPKLFFTDTGLAAWLAGFSDSASLATSAQAGAFWENHVVSQWIRRKEWLEPAVALWFWRDQAGREVDLVIEKNGLLNPVECKRKERPTLGDCQGIERLRSFYGAESVGPASIACLTDRDYDLSPGIRARSGWTTWNMR